MATKIFEVPRTFELPKTYPLPRKRTIFLLRRLRLPNELIDMIIRLIDEPTALNHSCVHATGPRMLRRNTSELHGAVASHLERNVWAFAVTVLVEAPYYYQYHDVSDEQAAADRAAAIKATENGFRFEVGVEADRVRSGGKGAGIVWFPEVVCEKAKTCKVLLRVLKEDVVDEPAWSTFFDNLGERGIASIHVYARADDGMRVGVHEIEQSSYDIAMPGELKWRGM